MALNTCEMWSNGIKIAFFSKKLQLFSKKSPNGWEPRPQPSFVTLLSYTNFLNTFPKLDIYIF